MVIDFIEWGLSKIWEKEKNRIKWFVKSCVKTWEICKIKTILCIYAKKLFMEKSSQISIMRLNEEFYEGDVEAIAAGVVGVMSSSLIYRIKRNRDVDVKKVYQGFIDTVVRGISKKN